MSKMLSLKMKEDDYKMMEEWVRKTKKTRNAYINEAVRLYNRLQKRNLLGAQMRRESLRVRENSMAVHHEFDAIRGETLKDL